MSAQLQKTEISNIKWPKYTHACLNEFDYTAPMPVDEFNMMMWALDDVEDMIDMELRTKVLRLKKRRK